MARVKEEGGEEGGGEEEGRRVCRGQSCRACGSGGLAF